LTCLETLAGNGLGNRTPLGGRTEVETCPRLHNREYHPAQEIGFEEDGLKLYVCWGTFPVPWPRRGASWRPAAHPCKVACDALTEVGHSPEVVKVYGFGQLPAVTRGRKEVKRLTGESWVPVLVLNDGEVVKGSKNIAAWARDNPANDVEERR
jgi:hypothetical protein